MVRDFAGGRSIAIDPAAPAPGRPRWFDLDRFAGDPALRAWILRCDDLEAALARAPGGSGVPMRFARGDLRWRMAVPGDGVLPFDGVFPALIEWQAGGHPAARLPDRGVRLHALELTHPRPEALRKELARVLDDPRVTLHAGARPGIVAVLQTPGGAVRL
ncbi:MAG: hypothetical protein Kow0013_20150 [Pararhodobacter sp.]